MKQITRGPGPWPEFSLEVPILAPHPFFSRVSRGGLATLFLALVVPGQCLGENPSPSVNQTASVDECSNTAAEWVFCSGFEEGNLEIWDDYDGNPEPDNLLMEHPGPLNQPGNHVMRLRVPPGRGTADLVKVLPGTYDRLYARWTVQWEPGYNFNALNHGSGLHAGGRAYLGRSGNRPTGSDWFSSWLEPRTTTHRMDAYTYYRGMYQDCVDPAGSCWGDEFPCTIDDGAAYCEKPQHRETILPPVFEAGRWYCIEVMMDGGTPSADGVGADGVLNWWIDGVEIGPWNDLWLRTTADLKLNILWLSLFHHAEHSVEGLMIDDVVVSTSRIGCRAGGPGTPDEATTWDAVKAQYR